MSLTPAMNADVNTSDDDSQSLFKFFLLMFVMLLLPGIALVFVCCCRRNRQTHADLVAERLRRQAQITEALASANPTQLRLQVVQRLVPPPPPVDEKHKGGLVLSYDTETQVYQWNNETVSTEESCSICLDSLSSCCQTTLMDTTSPDHLEKGGQQQDATKDSEDSDIQQPQQHPPVLKSKCGHAFHWGCIWGWITVKDECPYCRQSMWDASVFQRLQDEVLLASPNGTSDSTEGQEADTRSESTRQNEELTE